MSKSFFNSLSVLTYKEKNIQLQKQVQKYTNPGSTVIIRIISTMSTYSNTSFKSVFGLTAIPTLIFACKEKKNEKKNERA